MNNVNKVPFPWNHIHHNRLGDCHENERATAVAAEVEAAT
jgi:hypothetical protein